MRRPRFFRWIRTQVLEVAGVRTFNLRKLAAQAQRDSSSDLAAALLLYAHENDCLDRFLAYVHDEQLREEFAVVEGRLGRRSIERLALRGTPMQSLPVQYRAFLDAYERAYHTPERIAAEKAVLLDQARASMLASGISPAELARKLGADPANVSAFLVRGETHRLTLDKARQLAAACAA